VVLLAGPYTGYSPPAMIDAWFPTGYFTNFRGVVERYPDAYYGSRLPYLLPGVGLYAVFPPKVANFLLNLLIHGTSVSALLAIASRELDRRWALALVVLFAVNPWLVGCAVWDYNDGAAIAYFLAGYAVALAARDRLAPSPVRLLAVGACWLCAVCVNLIAALVILPASIHLMLWPWRGWREAGRRAVWTSAGAVLAFVPWAIAAKALLGLWFFPWLQVMQVMYAAERPDYLPGIWGSGEFVLRSSRLVALFGPILAAIPVLCVRRARSPDFLATFVWCAASAVLFLAGELADKALLRGVYHASYLLAPSFIVSVMLMRATVSSTTSPADARFAPAVLVVIALAIGVAFAFVPDLGAAAWPVLAGSTALFVAAALWRGRLAVRHGLAAATMAVVLTISTATDDRLRWVYRDNSELYAVTMRAQSLLMSGVLTGHKIRFWYDRSDRDWPLFRIINSLYLYYYRDLTLELPKLGRAELGKILPQGVVLIHLCSEACRLEPRLAQLRTAGIVAVPAARWRLRAPAGGDFEIVVHKTQREP